MHALYGMKTTGTVQRNARASAYYGGQEGMICQELVGFAIVHWNVNRWFGPRIVGIEHRSYTDAL